MINEIKLKYLPRITGLSLFSQGILLSKRSELRNNIVAEQGKRLFTCNKQRLLYLQIICKADSDRQLCHSARAPANPPERLLPRRLARLPTQPGHNTHFRGIGALCMSTLLTAKSHLISLIITMRQYTDNW